jgi:hypothetical protein
MTIRKTNGDLPWLPWSASRRLASVIVGLSLLAGCGGGSKDPTAPAKRSTNLDATAKRSRYLDATAKMRVVTAQGALPIIEKGALVGNFDAQLTVTLQSAGATGAESKAFVIQTSEGSIAGHAQLSSYSMGSPIIAHDALSITSGTGVFAHASSSNLMFKTESSGLPGTPNDKITIAVTGTVSD